MLAQPADLRRHVTGIGYLPCDLEHPARIDSRNLRGRAAIEPDQRGVYRRARGIDGDAAVELPCNRERADVLPAGPGGGQGSRDDRRERLLPAPRVLLGTIRGRVVRGVGHRKLATNREGRITDNRLDTLRTEIETEDEHHVRC